MVSPGSYILSALALALLGLSLGFSAVRLRGRLLPAWRGAPARLAESILFLALLTLLSELLGILNLFYAWTLVISSALLASALAWQFRVPTVSSTGGAAAGGPRAAEARSAPSTVGVVRRDVTRGQTLLDLVVVAVIAVVFAHWGLTTKNALDRGIFNFDTLWYHLPFATEMARSHSVTGLHYPETVFTNWFYPQNAELLHAVGILLVHRDTLSLFVNFAFLGLAFLAAWCVGRPYGRAELTVIAAAIVLECHTLVVREPGAAKNDLMAAALLLAGIAILVQAWARNRSQAPPGEAGSLPVGWPVAIAGLAAGMAVGTKSTGVAMAAALTVAVIALAPAGRRLAAAGWWLLPAFAGGGFWYLRNLVVAGNPLPQATSLGPISLPHPERLQSGRPDFSIAHYATDTAVWREYFAPGLHQAFGILWPIVLAGSLAGAVVALLRGDRAIRWIGGVVLIGMLAYLVTPLSAAGAEGAPTGFAINIRYAIPALLAGVVLLPVAIGRRGRRPLREGSTRPSAGTWAAAGALLAILVVTNRSDAVLRDPSRLFAWLIAVLAVLIPAALLFARRRAASAAAVAAGFAALAVAVAAIAYPVERSYLRDRFRNENPATSIPGMGLDFAYRWARDVHGARIGLAGTTAGFQQFGFYGTDLSNVVRYLGVQGPHGAFNAIPDCRRFRAAVNAANLDYLVTAPFLNFIHPGNPLFSPEANWLRGEAAVAPLKRSGRVTIWKVRGRLDPAACGRKNAPLRFIPQQPG